MFKFSALMLCLLFFLSLSSCKKQLGVDMPASSPVAVFEEFGQVMETRYALFREKGVDWAQARNFYGRSINNNMTERQLFNVMRTAAEVLRDGHVSVIALFDTATYDGFYTLHPRNFDSVILFRNYLNANNVKQLAGVYYLRSNNIGYIYIPGFYSNLSTSTLENIFQELVQTKGLIIDLRNNRGGFVSNANRLFSHLIRQKTLVKYELKKNGPRPNDFAASIPTYIEPAAPYYAGKVIVLTNRACYSACNDFVAYTLTLPDVQRFGDRTGGGGAIPQQYRLVNGFTLQYSASSTLDVSGNSIESGVLPTRDILMTGLDMAASKDPILEAAFFALR